MKKQRKQIRQLQPLNEGDEVWIKAEVNIPESNEEPYVEVSIKDEATGEWNLISLRRESVYGRQDEKTD